MVESIFGRRVGLLLSLVFLLLGSLGVSVWSCVLVGYLLVLLLHLDGFYMNLI